MSNRDKGLAEFERAPADGAAQTLRLHVRSYGCQMNVYDSQRMADTLAPHGFVETATADDADLVILNTCHIRERAAEKVYSELGRIRVLKEQAAEAGRRVTVAVAGCVAQAEGAEILRRAPVVDLVVGPQSYHRLPQMLERSRSERVVDTEFPVEDKFDHLAQPGPAKVRERGISAFLTVQEGCDKFCTFCVVPYTRGAELSRPVDRILGEARRLAEAGVRELTLIGQNVNAFHGEGPDGRPWSLSRLLYRLAEVPGIARLRYTTSHPRDMGDDLIAAHCDLPALMPQLHLPVQSGSDRMLKAMNRGHSRADYLRVVERLRKARPDLAFSSDFIVGFPGETDADFEDTMRLIAEVGFASSFSFKYSSRPGTPAAEMAPLPEPLKDERLQRLQAEILRVQNAFSNSCVGRTFDILFEKRGRHPGQMVGKSPYLHSVHVMGPASLAGRIEPVRINERLSFTFNGVLAGQDPAAADRDRADRDTADMGVSAGSLIA